jgi:enoyl-CoA hydratase/carnithine racemase
MNEVRVNMTIPHWAIDIIKDAIPPATAKKMLKYEDPITTDELASIGVIEDICFDSAQLDADRYHFNSTILIVIPMAWSRGAR